MFRLECIIIRSLSIDIFRIFLFTIVKKKFAHVEMTTCGSIITEDSNGAKQDFVGKKILLNKIFTVLIDFNDFEYLWIALNSINCLELYKFSVILKWILRFSQLSFYTLSSLPVVSNPNARNLERVLAAVTAKVKARLKFLNPLKQFNVQQIQFKQIRVLYAT